MSLLRKLGNLWLGTVYRAQKSHRLDKDIHRATAASSRNCGNCLRCKGSLVFRRCQSSTLVVHRGDSCRRFILKVED